MATKENYPLGAPHPDRIERCPKCQGNHEGPFTCEHGRHKFYYLDASKVITDPKFFSILGIAGVDARAQERQKELEKVTKLLLNATHLLVPVAAQKGEMQSGDYYRDLKNFLGKFKKWNDVELKKEEVE